MTAAHRENPNLRPICHGGTGIVRHRAFTLVECLLAVSILAVAVLAVAQALAAGQTQTHEALHHARAMQLAKAMIHEVLAKPHGTGATGLGPESDESERADFNEINDYHSFSEAIGELKDAHDVLYPAEFQGFSRAVSIVPQTLTIDAVMDAGAGLSVQVTVTDTRGQTWTLTRFVPL